MYEGNNSVFNGNSPSTPTFTPASAYAYPPKKSKKKFIIISAIIILCTTGIAIWFLVIMPSMYISKDEARPIIEDFYTQYDSFIQIYMATISFAPTKDMASWSFVPIEGQTSEIISTSLGAAKEAHSEIAKMGDIHSVPKELNDNLRSIISMAGDFLEVADRNIKIAIRFNVAFVEPIISLVVDGTNCYMSTEAQALLGDDNQTIAVAAEAYRDAYCDVYNTTVLGIPTLTSLTDKLNKARNALARTFAPYDYGNTGLRQLSNLNMELKQ